MERTPSTPRTKSSSTILDQLASPRACLAAALAAILAAPAAGCGGEETQDTPDAGIALCETPERADAPAPRITVQTDNIVKQDNRIRIPFHVPGFDKACRAPFFVHARATIWRPAEEVPLGEEPNAKPLSSQVQLPGETTVYEPGEYFLDTECIPNAARISSITLHVVDAAGQEYVTLPFSPFE